MLTRRERLERIASAERDRRAGRIELAVASLGEGTEWPARVVLALARLPEDEGDETRRILVASLDAWAVEAGLPSLAPDLGAGASIETEAESAPEAKVDLSVAPVIEAALPSGLAAEDPSNVSGISGISGVSDDSDEEEAEVWPSHPVDAVDLDSPLEVSELDAAFAAAEAQVDEMHDVNRVAERVLMEEANDLAEFVEEPGEILHGEEELEAVESEVERSALAIDAAWAEPSIWPAAAEGEGAEDFDVLADCTEGVDASLAFEAAAAPDESEMHSSRPSREVVLATLEHWLANLEKNSARRPR